MVQTADRASGLELKGEAESRNNVLWQHIVETYQRFAYCPGIGSKPGAFHFSHQAHIYYYTGGTSMSRAFGAGAILIPAPVSSRTISSMCS